MPKQEGGQIGTMTFPVLKCYRCGHEWQARKEQLPEVCANPKCKSRYWSRPRQTKNPLDKPTTT